MAFQSFLSVHSLSFDACGLNLGFL
jgi:hypothetical protein